MTGKELLLGTLRHQRLDAVPWVPFTGVHAGSLKGYSASEVLQDGDKLLEALLEAHAQYRPDGQPVLFDLQVEAEILGCQLQWAQKAPPAVAVHPLATAATIPSHLPEPTDGRLPLILETMGRMVNAVGESTALFGLVCGPFTLASHLRGTEIFMDLFDQPQYVDQLVDFAAHFGQRLASFYLAAGMDVLAVVDPLVSQISPDHFQRFLAAPFSQFFTTLRQAGAPSAFFVCGDATRNLACMCRTGPDALFVDENIDMVAAQHITQRHNIALGGNLPLASVMLQGSQQDNMQSVLDLLDHLDHHNLIIAPGCDMPYDIPPENAIGAMEAVRDPQSARRLLANYQRQDLAEEVELPDYAHLERPLVEAFTLDSATCPACTYMMLALKDAAAHFKSGLDLVEYKIVEPANVARARQMGIKNLPCVFIDGTLAFSSIIPPRRELLARIQTRLG